ncbi:winged helix-turn-helix domain-containing protein [Kitasatospora sp. NPDC097691]|uniref:winged helix-turn-helix domain-containing protein n=1 Tax=Kitasatospora sp. NPDC097691 TaxID=3157231 RepID=UPI00331ABA7F
MTEFQGAPAYLQLADDLREQIRSGKLAAGTALSSTQKLMDSHGVSSTVVKNAVSLLRAEGYVIGHQGKGVFVQLPPRLAGHSRGAADWAVPVLQASQALEQALRELARGEGKGTDAEAALQRWRAAFDALPDSLKSRLAE